MTSRESGDAIVRAVARTREESGRIDILFNNAGICFYGRSHELSEAEWDTMLDINLKGAWVVGTSTACHSNTTAAAEFRSGRCVHSLVCAIGGSIS